MMPIMGKILSNYLRKRNLVMFYTSNTNKQKVYDLIGKIKNETQSTMLDAESFQLYNAVLNTSKVEGDIAEVGVFMGASAKLICEAKGNKNLYLFDTFNGLPNPSESDDKRLEKGNFSEASVEWIATYLKSYSNIHIFKGLFPSTSKPIAGKKFSLVNLDVDIYKSTLDSLKFFYPRMNKGGIIMSHDYNLLNGVKKAFDEYFKDKPEPIVELLGTQCLIVKV